MHASSSLSRRELLVGAGALSLLSACGGGGTGSASATTTPGVPAPALTPPVTPQGWGHPGLLHTQADLTRMATQVAAKASPWLEGWNRLATNAHASLSWQPRPVSVVYRGNDGVHGQNYALLYNDVAAAYAHALHWQVSGDTAHADKAVSILNAWSSTLTSIQGTADAQLAAGLYGYQLANAAELLRGYGRWQADDLARAQALLLNVFYPICHDFLVRHNGAQITHYWSNWDLCNMAAILAIGVFAEQRALVDEAVAYFMSGAGNGCIRQAVYYLHPGHLGQTQEAGRDQGHNTLSVALLAALCEMAWNQGVDLYGFDNNRVLAAAEYVAMGNLADAAGIFPAMPFVPYRNATNGAQTSFATGSQGSIRPNWASLHHHYVNRRGLAAPFTTRMMQKAAPEGGGGDYGPNSGGYDQLGYGTLTCTRSPIAAGTPPSGLTAHLVAGQVRLSWWGSAGASGYTVKRASRSDGPYTVLQSGLTHPLTFTDTTLADGATGHYVVTADTPLGETAPSAPAQVTAGRVLLSRWAFDGKGTETTLPADVLSALSDFSVAAKVFWNGNQTWARVFDFGAGTGRYLMLTPRASNGLARFAITLNGYLGEQTLDAPSALPAGRWVHVAVTLSGQTGTLYLDGVPVGTHTAMSFAPCQVGATHQNWLGRSQFATDPTFSGQIDDVRLYSGALTATEVAALAR